MSLSFPISPSIGQVYQTWQWNGSAWTPTPGGIVAAQVALEVNLAANQTTGVSLITWSTVKYDTKVTDVQNAYNPATGLFTPTVAGLYSVSASVGVYQGVSVGCGIAIVKNGAALNAESQRNFFVNGSAGAQVNTVSISALIYCNGVNDSISVQGYGNDTKFYAAANLTAAPFGAVNMVATLLQTGPQGPPGSGLLGQQVFTASGTYTPTPGMVRCVIECVGGGGGGGGTNGTPGAGNLWVAGGGGAGGYSKRVCTAAQIGASQPVTIGAAGAAGTGTTAGSAGGTTSLGALCVANGGAGGCTGFAGTPVAAGGAPGTGDLAIPGQNGAPAAAGVAPASGWGGSGLYGAGAAGKNSGSSTNPGYNGLGYGAGGGGSIAGQSSPNQPGGNGTNGIVIVTEY